MFMRLLYLQGKSDDIDILRSFYDTTVIPALQKIEGCLFAGLLQSTSDVRDGISLTLWDTKKHSENYEKSGVYKKLLDQAAPFLAEATEWKVQLSEDLELEYKPSGSAAELEQYTVTVHERVKQDLFQQHSMMYVRIVSQILQRDKVDEFRKIYMDKIIPELREIKGCRYVYLIESMQQANEVNSITIWDSKEDADEYEKSGLFHKLVDRLKPTFSQFYQWKMTLEKDKKDKVSTSDDLKITDYKIVTGKNLRRDLPDHR
jgi:heme-degrading monooxygenase HmoA